MEWFRRLAPDLFSKFLIYTSGSFTRAEETKEFTVPPALDPPQRMPLPALPVPLVFLLCSGPRTNQDQTEKCVGLLYMRKPKRSLGDAAGNSRSRGCQVGPSVALGVGYLYTSRRGICQAIAGS